MMKRASRGYLFAGAGYGKARDGSALRGGLFRIDRADGSVTEVTAGLPPLAEARAFAIAPGDPDHVFAGTQDGPYRSQDAGGHWERMNFPVRNAQIWSLVFHPARPDVMFAGAAPVAIYRSDDAGRSWRHLDGVVSPEHCPMRFPTRVTGIALDRARPDDIFAALEVSGVIVSRDGGQTWADVSAPLIKLAEQPHLMSRESSERDDSGMLDSHTIVVNGGTALLGVRMGIFATPDHGTSWMDFGIGQFSAPMNYCRDLIVCPHDPQVMYACQSASSRGTVGSLYRTADAGRTWTRIDHGFTARATMMSVAVDPVDPARIVCASRCGQVFETCDTGASWREYALPEGVHDVYAVACL